MTWEDIMNCICNSPSSGMRLQDLLRALERHTVCTGARCFEDEADVFGAAPGQEGAGGNTGMFLAFMVMLMAAAAVIRANRPTPALTDKSGGDAPGRDDDPPPVL
mmetsp:Transcript_21125/g.70998  ORF Transcript_21125/g.70998 Transcript_21125/m.70998 type:complete len:105 (+) Transcript_21125:114-428(+)